MALCHKLAKRLSGHVITGLFQFKLLLCQTMTKRTRLSFLWISSNSFLYGENRQNAKESSIESDLSLNGDVFQTGYTYTN